MMYVTALQPANSGSMYVSAHMEYAENEQVWLAVPTARTELGEAYRSPRYAGIRDYVKFDNCTADTLRRVCLFMPYDAAGLPNNRTYQRRYVLRVWDQRNEPIARVNLAPEAVQTRRDEHGKMQILTIKVKTCSIPAFQEWGSDDPIPEFEDHGSLQMFSTKTGEFLCPSEEAQ
jgi:hypothetical protein